MMAGAVTGTSGMPVTPKELGVIVAQAERLGVPCHVRVGDDVRVFPENPLELERVPVSIFGRREAGVTLKLRRIGGGTWHEDFGSVEGAAECMVASVKAALGGLRPAGAPEAAGQHGDD